MIGYTEEEYDELKTEKMEVTELLNGLTISYDKGGQQIYAKQQDEATIHLANIRGYSYFVSRFDDNAEAMQDAVGEFIAQAIKEKLQQDTLINYWFTDEHSHEVTVRAVVDEWCIVTEDGKERPYALQKEFVLAIRATGT